MKLGCVYLLIVGCLIFSSGCQERVKLEPGVELGEGTMVQPAGGTKTVPEPAVIDGPPPKIVFEATTHDFGQVGAGTQNVCEFKFTNAGKGVLKIKEVTRSCGCTPWTLEKKEYQPGETGTLKVTYHAPAAEGSQGRRLSVYSNDPLSPKVDLTIKAKIVVRVVFDPKRLNLSLKQENLGSQKITITAKDGKEFSITSVTSAPSGITADFDPIEKATRFVLEPKIDVEQLKKGLSGMIQIGLTHPENKKIQILFSILSKFKITPPSIALFNAEAGVPIRRQVWVLNNYNEDFEVESTSSQSGLIKVLSQEKQGNRYTFDLEITPSVPGAGRTSIFQDEFYVKIKGDETLRVVCRGFFKRK